MKDVHVHRVVSEEKLSPFAPSWNFSIIEGVIENVDFGHIAKLLLEKQDEILKIKPQNDGMSGLGMKSITARHLDFNTFNFDDPELNKLKDNINTLHNVYLQILGLTEEIPKTELWCKSWYNVMRKGQRIKPHLHDLAPDAYLGGNIVVQCDDTTTSYMHPYHAFVRAKNPDVDYKSKNEVGKITLFPNYIPHCTTIHKGDTERITIAFDLLTKKESDIFIKL